MKNYEIAIPNANEDVIRGKIYLPDELKKEMNCVIISHGFLANSSSVEDVAKELIQHDIVAIAFDFNGAPNGKSDGAVEEMSVLTQVQDLKDVIKFTRSFKEIKKLFLLGFSQGGFVSAIVADEMPEISGLILVYPALVIPDDARKLYGSKENIPDDPKALDTPVGRKYFEDVIELDSLEMIKSYKGPVLILHGDADQIAPISYSEKADENYENSKLIKYPGQGHKFDQEYRQKMIQDILDFVKEQS